MPEPDVSPSAGMRALANDSQPRFRLPCAEVLLPSCASPINVCRFIPALSVSEKGPETPETILR
jgi:hypothetical protein